MTPGPLNISLSALYDRSRQDVKAHLGKQFLLVESTADDTEAAAINRQWSLLGAPWTIWRIKACGTTSMYDLLVAMPPTFPDALPKLYLSHADFKRIGRVPHVDRNRFICTRDERVIVINEARCGEAVEDLIQIALETLDKGTAGQNKEDRMSEIIAYWNDEAENDIDILSIIKVADQARTIGLYSLTHGLFGKSGLVLADTEEDVKHWLTSLSPEIQCKHEEAVLFLPIADIGNWQMTSNRDVAAIFDGLDVPAQSVFSMYLGLTVVITAARFFDDVAICGMKSLQSASG